MEVLGHAENKYSQRNYLERQNTTFTALQTCHVESGAVTLPFPIANILDLQQASERLMFLTVQPYMQKWCVWWGDGREDPVQHGLPTSSDASTRVSPQGEYEVVLNVTKYILAHSRFLLLRNRFPNMKYDSVLRG